MASDTIDGSFKEELRLLVANGERLEAVRRFRERTGKGMQEARDAVEDLARQKDITQRQTDSLEWDVITLLERGQKPQAIAFYRQRTGSGLKESRDAIERIASEHNLVPPGGPGCLGVVLIATALAALSAS